MKRIASFVFVFILLFGFTVNAQIKVFVNNIEVEFDQSPVIVNDRTLVPLRKIFEALDAEVVWNEETDTVTAYKDDTVIGLCIGDNIANVNGNDIILDVPPEIINDRTLVPLRFIAESLGCRTDWQEKTQNIYITDEDNRFGRDLKIVFFDVGQGDCILVMLPDGKNMIIDGATSGKSETAINKLKNMGITDIDYVIGTHPHNDHIGGLDNIINKFNVHSVFMPKVQNDTEAFLSVLEAVLDKGLNITPAKGGYVLFDYNGLKGEFVAPVRDNYSELNNCSAVLRLTFLNKTFLFAGDAEIESERDQKGDISADVLKVGHHGSDNSTSEEYIKRVKPEYAVVSVGENNPFGHPSYKTLNCLENFGVEIFRTDEQGDIVALCDGYDIEFKTSDEAEVELYPEVVYVTVTGKKFHKEDCKFLTDTKRAVLISDAVKNYTPCSVCFK